MPNSMPYISRIIRVAKNLYVHFRYADLILKNISTLFEIKKIDILPLKW